MRKDQIVEQLSREDKELIEQYKRSILDSQSKLSSQDKYSSINEDLSSGRGKSWISNKSSPGKEGDLPKESTINRLNAIVFNATDKFSDLGSKKESPLYEDKREQVKELIDEQIKHKQYEYKRPTGRLVVPTIEELESKAQTTNLDQHEEKTYLEESKLDKAEEKSRSEEKKSPIRQAKTMDSPKPDYTEFSGDFRNLLENKYNSYLKRTQKQQLIKDAEPVKKETVKVQRHYKTKPAPAAAVTKAKTNVRKPHRNPAVQQQAKTTMKKPEQKSRPKSAMGNKKKGCDVDKLLQMIRRHIKECPKFSKELKLEGFE